MEEVPVRMAGRPIETERGRQDRKRRGAGQSALETLRAIAHCELGVSASGSDAGDVPDGAASPLPVLGRGRADGRLRGVDLRGVSVAEALVGQALLSAHEAAEEVGVLHALQAEEAGPGHGPHPGVDALLARCAQKVLPNRDHPVAGLEALDAGRLCTLGQDVDLAESRGRRLRERRRILFVVRIGDLD